MALHWIDSLVICAYFVAVFAISLSIRKLAKKDAGQFFLAGRNMPWWLAGISIAATTFAADTPLAVTGIIAAKGLSGNWIWFAWLF